MSRQGQAVGISDKFETGVSNYLRPEGEVAWRV